jgi:hypothetical protein
MFFGMSSFTVTRSIETSASPADVRALVDDVREWSSWSPWCAADTAPGNARLEIGGPDFGEGAFIAWSGAGATTDGNAIVVLSAPGVVEVRLVITRPYRLNVPVQFAFDPVDGGTLVTCSASGDTRGAWSAFAAARRSRRLGRDLASALAGLSRRAAAGSAARVS